LKNQISYLPNILKKSEHYIFCDHFRVFIVMRKTLLNGYMFLV